MHYLLVFGTSGRTRTYKNLILSQGAMPIRLPRHYMVCVVGFEPTAFRFQTEYSGQTELHTGDAGASIVRSFQ